MKNPIYVLSWMMLFLCFSCTNEDVVLPVQEDARPTEQTDRILGLEPDVTNLQASDAETVAKIFTNKGNRSRSGSADIKNVVPIPGRDGKPSLYAVNLTDGYLIVPATKNLPPILAIVDEGSFTMNQTPSGRDVIIDQMIAENEYWKEKGGTDKHKSEWRAFTKFPSDAQEAVSRSNELDDPWNVMYATIMEFEDKGYECYRITKFEEVQDIMPDDILNKLKNRARFEDNIWEDEYGEDFMYETALVVIRDGYYQGSNYNLLTTKWGQGTPYNYMIGGVNNLGCVTIATAQIMKYHQYPASYNWSAMPDDLTFPYSNPLTNFLADLHNKLGVSDNGGANIGDAERVLKSYGYSVEKKSHQKDVYNTLPVYCRGQQGVLKDGHAWVCDGYQFVSYTNIYELYMFDNAYYPKFEYMKMQEETQLHESTPLYHMNWGWKGNSNGFYYDSDMNPKKSDGTIVHFNYMRQDLIISKP